MKKNPVIQHYFKHLSLSFKGRLFNMKRDGFYFDLVFDFPCVVGHNERVFPELRRLKVRAFFVPCSEFTQQRIVAGAWETGTSTYFYTILYMYEINGLLH